MRALYFSAVTIACITSVAIGQPVEPAGGVTHTVNSPYARFGTVGLDDVTWTGGFWADRLEQCRTVMLPHMWEVYFERAYENFRAAAGDIQSTFEGRWWMDGDLYKWMEAATWIYGVTGEPRLDRRLDEIIDVIARAQEEDGYLHTAVQIGRGHETLKNGRLRAFTYPARWAGQKMHEVYNLGHLITAACIHHRATRKRNFLTVAIKAADHLCEVFSDDDPDLDTLTGNPPHIMGLIELYRTTGIRKYLELAQVIVDRRGTSGKMTEQQQAQAPFRTLTEATGHVVFGTYLYSGVADLYMETGEPALRETLERLWTDVIDKRLYITGGAGANHFSVSQSSRQETSESFGWEYALPSSTAYNETCSNIGIAMWNWRMLTFSGDARYADLMETVFYNSLLSATNLEGTKYFYTNVLRHYGADHRLLSLDAYERKDREWECICCPPNIVRTIAEMNNYAYGISDHTLWVHLYGSNRLNTRLPGGSEITVRQESGYPWDGTIRITLESVTAGLQAIKLRIPGWAAGSSVRVNGRSVTQPVTPGAYMELKRAWAAGDVVELELPMRIRLIEGHPKVEELRNQVAVVRGPVVYVLESSDLPEHIAVSDVIIPRNHNLLPKYRADLLGGVTVLKGDALHRAPHQWESGLYQEVQPEPLNRFPVRLIPYYAWCNRGVCEMSVWLPFDW